MVDVLVIGGGNAALCAALVAREAGASVMLLEAAPREWRGGNSMHTRNLRVDRPASHGFLGAIERLQGYCSAGMLRGRDTWTVT